MSARKPLARMDSPVVTEGTADDVPVPTDGKEEVLKTEPTENGGKTDTTTEEKDIKEEKLETNDAEPILTQVDQSGPFDSKRVTRNSPMLIGSPLKKSCQENDSLSEMPSAADDAPKKSERSTVGRPRKQSDPTNKSSGITVPPTNRLTRKAAEQQLAANTRLTRARRASAGIGARPETPPKRRNISKTKIEPPAPAVKRKRSASPKLADEPDIKVQKAEDQDADFELNAVIVKQEVLESSEEMASDVASDITEPFPSRISLRARKSATCYSPTTRSYRREKDKEKKEESTIPDGKRKRLTRVRPDEDSKDSLASSNMDDMVEIKIEEKFESEDANEAILPTIPSFEETATAGAVEVETNGNKTEDTTEPIDLPLTVDTTDVITPLIVENTEIQPETDGPSTSVAASEQSNSPDKAASLSPDLVSEGVSEISVKRFYKKPEFLKNNLGIENDPKLGEIVQNVAEKMAEAADEASVSNDSIKEGELVFEEEDEVASIGSTKNENEDENSVSTGLNSPLIVEEEDEDEVGNTQLALEIEMAEKVDAKDENEDMDKEKEKETETEKDLDIKEDVAIKEVVSGNGPVDCKSEELLVEEKLESSLKAVLDGIEKIEVDAPETTENTEALQFPIKEEKMTDTPFEENQDVETQDQDPEIENIKDHKMEEIEKEKTQEIMTEEFKTEEITIEENIIDQEENKENVGLMIKSVKEGVQEVSTTPENVHDASMSTDEQESPCGSSKTSPSKIQADISGEGTTPSTSPQSSKSSSVPRTPENDERLRQKERHFKTLGLLTHKAADEAKMAKQKRRKFLHNISSNSGSKKTTNANTGSAVGNAQNKSSQEYTGTLKTVIKLNRQSGGGGANEPKKGKNVDNTGAKVANAGCGSRRQSLKMTFQKGRGRPTNTEKSGDHPANTSGEDSYYTIQNEGEGAAISTSASVGETSNSITTASTTTTAHGRKSYNRSNTSDASHHHTEHHEVAASKKDEKEEILIPEKASSFKFHPGRLCQDQCYYCSGKFGLYDTPCHVGQIKSVERQQKILANEEKLTVDNCLCDACFRHVDRRANVPSYKKRLSAPGHIETVKATAAAEDSPNEQEKTQQEQQKPPPQSHVNGSAAAASHTCAVPDCNEIAAHSLRRKGIRKSIKKSLLNFDMSTAGTYLHICEKHYEAVVQSSGCVLCKRRLGKSNMYHITTDTDRLEKALADMGIPVALGQGTAVCKLCRYFANLLMKPPENGKVQKVQFVKNYRKRLLQFYNIHDKKDTSNEDSEEEKSKEKSSKKQSAASTSKRPARKSRTPEEEAKEVDEMEMDMGPPSPAHSTGSSVEMISDGNIFNADDESTTTPNITATNAASNQMVLDNDVMVDYDVPMMSNSSSSSNSTSPSPQRMKDGNEQQSKLKAILQSNGTSLEDRNDISNVLRSNPNISMRELFPGEEDLGLQFKAPFGSSSSQRTPEGWIRVNTFLQYDEPTRRLWEELQKPYGNQSSFLRHLILLEKYYRNGDLVLSSTASSNASVYSRTVRNRLTSFDSHSSASSSPSKELECRSRSLSVDKIQRQLSSNSVTITARPKEPKVQQKDDEHTQQRDGGTNSTGGSSGGPAPAKSTPNSRSILKTNLIGVKGGAIEIVPLSSANSLSSSPHSSSGSNTPNDNTSLTKQQKILAAANKLMSNKLETSPNPKKNTLNTTPPELISLNRRPAASASQTKRPQILPKPMASGKPAPIPPNVIVLPDTLTSQERLESKSWRPTLLPVTTTSHHLNNQQGPLYQTADGRRLPALVQVQSGGRPFLISIHDYNRMCILRREKLMRDQMLKGSKGKLKGAIFPNATCVSNNNNNNNNKISELQSFNKTMPSGTAAENTAKKQRQIMSKANFKIGNYTPIAPKPSQTTTTTSTTPPSTSTSQQQLQTQPPTTMLMPPISLLSSNQPTTLSILPGFTGQVVPLLNTNASTAAAATATGVPQNPWLWHNFPDTNQMLVNGKATKGVVTSMKQQQSLLLDNNLMSKIPKSLTVIPQHKLMPQISLGSANVTGNVSKD